MIRTIRAVAVTVGPTARTMGNAIGPRPLQRRIAAWKIRRWPMGRPLLMVRYSTSNTSTGAEKVSIQSEKACAPNVALSLFHWPMPSLPRRLQYPGSII